MKKADAAVRLTGGEGADRMNSAHGTGDRSEKSAGVEGLCLGPRLRPFGIADVAGLRDDFLLEPATRDSFGLAVSLGKRLSDAVLDDIQDRPTSIYFHHYRQMNFFRPRGASRCRLYPEAGIPVAGHCGLADHRLEEAAGPRLA